MKVLILTDEQYDEIQRLIDEDRDLAEASSRAGLDVARLVSIAESRSQVETDLADTLADLVDEAVDAPWWVKMLSAPNQGPWWPDLEESGEDPTFDRWIVCAGEEQNPTVILENLDERTAMLLVAAQNALIGQDATSWIVRVDLLEVWLDAALKWADLFHLIPEAEDALEGDPLRRWEQTLEQMARRLHQEILETFRRYEVTVAGWPEPLILNAANEEHAWLIVRWMLQVDENEVAVSIKPV